jgi:membrane associated rhomboid family serine protease
MIPIKNSVPARFPPTATYALIAVNVLAFLFQISLPARQQQAFLYMHGLVPARYTHPDWALQIGLDPGAYSPFLTNTFLHGGWLHLIINMWTLWLFGGAVEDRLGSWRYVLFYLASGVAGSIAHAWANPQSNVPAIGASGAIAGVLGAYVRLFPRANIVLLVPLGFIPLFFVVPAVTYVAVWFTLQLLQGAFATLRPQAGGIAWWAHIGGFLAGVLLVPLLRRSRPAYRPYFGDEGVLGFRSRGEM